MNSSLSKKEKLKIILSETYHQRENDLVSDTWQARVMRDIRNMDMPDKAKNGLVSLEKMVWRFAPVACVLIITLAMILFTYDFVPEYTLAEAFMDDSIDMVLAQSTGF